jgi:small-conductance mechanosensitive channel
MIISESDIDEKYVKEDKTISMLKANIYAVLIMLPAVAVMFVLYQFVYKSVELTAHLSETLIFLGCYLLLIVAHEWLHGLTAHFYCENKWKSIQFGVKQLTPYCHCKELLKIWQYRKVAITPLIFTGILPYILALIWGSAFWMIISIFMVIGAGGDMMILFLLRKEKPDTVVCDHPTLCGCILYREKIR